MDVFHNLCGLSVNINQRNLRVIRLLGEGAFSYVYLVQEDATGSLYALKKIRCPFGQESVKHALTEVETYSLFNHENIIRCIDSAVVQERDGRIVYIVLPYFKNGNLQDAINSNMVNHTKFPEKQVLQIFRGICLALQQLHEHSLATSSVIGRGVTEQASPETSEAEEPLMANTRKADRIEVSSIVPYTHNDIKPGNVMLADDGFTPVIMDFGSVTRARREIKSRQDALEIQDRAAEHSTMPYRAPELFDTKTGSVIDEKVDIWSLGCTLFALLYRHSPFETSQTSQGGSIALAAMNAQYKFPEDDFYSELTRGIVARCLQVASSERPSAQELIISVDTILRRTFS